MPDEFKTDYDYDYDKQLENKRMEALLNLATVAGIVGSQTYDDMIAYGANKSIYNKYKAAKVLDASHDANGKINLKYPEHMEGLKGDVARTWKAANPILQKVGVFAKYYPTAKLLWDDAKFVSQTPQYQDFDRWVQGQGPLDNNAL